MEDYRLEQTGQEVQRILNGAAMDANLQAEVERATDAEGTLQENIDAEAQARQDADGLLQQGIDDEAQRAKDAEEANAGDIEGIKALIPSTASEVNKLADTNYVNSSIQTATAEYRGDYNVVTDLHLAIDATHAQIETLLPTVIAEADKNDYCYVMIPTNASTPTEIAKIERYKMTSEGWKFEYDVNNSTFTAEEWAAIKSGITSGLVAKLNALPTNSDLLLLLAAKQDVLTFDSVPVPESNNPVKSGGVYSAIDDEKTARLNSDTAIHTELDGLQAKVPATASSDNKLVDQNQMNSSISTATATFRGDWNVVSDLHLAVDATRAQIAALLPTVISTADNNDYCYVEIPTSAETPAQIERVERYKFNGTAWAFEYVLNNSGFTAAQWAAINSMITSGLVAKLSALPTNADLLAMLAQKQDNLTFDSTPTENSTNPVTSGGVFAADKALSDAIEAILLLIPSAATSLNKLVDTALMNSSISTATATFRGTYNLVSNLGLGIDATEGQIAAALSTAISTADNNDYAFVQIPTSAETPAQIARTDRYKFNGTAWAFEYTLNTSGFTAAQWAAINSTITSALVAKLNDLPTAAELQEALGTLTSGITAINQKIPSTASESNKLVDNASMESYIAQVINILDASFNVTSTDGHITLHITQVDGKITAVQVQSSDIASAADLALKASQADLTALASRVSTAEGNITSLTGRMGTAETNIAYLQQLYNNLQQSKPVPVTALPGTGQQQGVIYRLAGTTSYSDYMWNGSSWVLMATYNNAIDAEPTYNSQNLTQSGGIFKYTSAEYLKKPTPVGVYSGYLNRSGMFVSHAVSKTLVFSYQDVIGSIVKGQVSNTYGYIYYYTNSDFTGVVIGVNHNTSGTDDVYYVIPSGINAAYVAISMFEVSWLNIYSFENDILKNTFDDVYNRLGMRVDLSQGTRIVKYVGNDKSIKNNNFSGGYIFDLSAYNDDDVIGIIGVFSGQYLTAYAIFNSALDLNDLDNTFISSNIITIGPTHVSSYSEDLTTYFCKRHNYAYLWVYDGLYMCHKQSIGQLQQYIDDNYVKKERLSQYLVKKIMFIGDSFCGLAEATRTMFWQYLQTMKGMNVVTPNGGATPPNVVPAKGGIPLFPKDDESDLLMASIWKRCNDGICTGWAAQVIGLLGGANNELTLENIGTINDVAYVDNTSNITEDANITDVRPSSFTYASILKGCVLMLRAYNPGAEVIILSYPYNIHQGNVADAVVNINIQVANKYGLKFVPVYYDIPHNENLFADTVHLNSNGGLLMARSFCDTLLV